MKAETKMLILATYKLDENTKLSPLYKFLHTLDGVLRERAVNNLDKQPF